MTPRLFWARPHRQIRAALVGETGETVTGDSTEATYKAWTNRRTLLGILPENPLAAFSHDACMALGPVKRNENCQPAGNTHEPGVLKRRRIVGLADILRFLSTAKDWILSRNCVPQAEADRRAEICAMCPLNTEAITGCSGCTNYAAELFAAIGDKRTPAHAVLKSCEVCGCENKVQVWAPLEVLSAHSGGLDYPEWCWKK